MKVEKQEKAQDLENLVRLLKEQRDDADKGMRNNLSEALMFGGASAVLLYLGIIFDPRVSYEITGIIEEIGQVILQMTKYVLCLVGGGLFAASSLIAGARSVLDYHRSDLLGDRIAEIEQSPDYRAKHDAGQHS